jgi:polar amino acid transport system ATP-binding protein
MIDIQAIRKRFGSLEVLKGISLDVGEGEVVVIIGPSGSGKSTFARYCAMKDEYFTDSLRSFGDPVNTFRTIRNAIVVELAEFCGC